MTYNTRGGTIFAKVAITSISFAKVNRHNYKFSHTMKHQLEFVRPVNCLFVHLLLIRLFICLILCFPWILHCLPFPLSACLNHVKLAILVVRSVTRLARCLFS